MTGEAAMLIAFIREAARFEPEVAQWVAAAVWAGLSPARRRRIRDDLLRQAAKALGPLSAWQKAHVLAELARHHSRPDVTTPEGLVALAQAVYRPSGRARALSAAQVFRVVSRISGGDMRAAPAGNSWPEMADVFRLEG